MRNNLQNAINVEKSRIDNLLTVETLDENSELIDIRTGSNGTIYESAGDAVRTQINDLNDELVGKINKPTTADNNKFPRAKNGNVEWVEQGLPTDEQTSSAVTNWLNTHPEATTTVQDYSLTFDKMVVGTLGYVTPEMFGAVGDGVTDDAIAINNAIATQKPVLFTKIYGVKSTVFVNGREIYKNATIKAINEFSDSFLSVIALTKSYVSYDFTGLTIDCNVIAPRGISNNDKMLFGISINNAYILNAKEAGLFIYSTAASTHGYVNNLKVYNEQTLSTGIYIRNNDDWTFNNVELFYVNIGVDFSGTHHFMHLHIWAGGDRNKNDNTIGFLLGSSKTFNYPIFIENTYFDGINTCIKSYVDTILATSNCYVYQPDEGTYGTNSCYIDTTSGTYLTINGLTQKTVSINYVPIRIPKITEGAMLYKQRYVVNSCIPFKTDKWNAFNCITSNEYEAVHIFSETGGISQNEEILIGNFILPTTNTLSNNFYFDFEIFPSYRFDGGFQNFLIRFYDVNKDEYSCEVISKNIIGIQFYDLILGEVVNNDNMKVIPVYMKWKSDNPYNSNYTVKTTRNQNGVFSAVNTCQIRENGFYTQKYNLTSSNV